MGKILDLAEDLWAEKKDTFSHHPFGVPRGIELIDEHNSQRTWFYRGFSNSIIRETAEGLVIIDPGASFDINWKFKSVRDRFLRTERSIIPDKLNRIDNSIDIEDPTNLYSYNLDLKKFLTPEEELLYNQFCNNKYQWSYRIDNILNKIKEYIHD